jgi:hypothetical protein
MFRTLNIIFLIAAVILFAAILLKIKDVIKRSIQKKKNKS